MLATRCFLVGEEDIVNVVPSKILSSDALSDTLAEPPSAQAHSFAPSPISFSFNTSLKGSISALGQLVLK